MSKINYTDKEFLNKNEEIADNRKVNDTDLNEIKQVVNENYDEFSEYTSGVCIKRLWSGNVTENNQTIELDEDYTNYDALIVCLRLDAGNQGIFRMNNQFIPADLINLAGNNLTMYIPINVGGQIMLTYTISDSNKITTNENFSYYFALKAVYGLKISKN